MGRTVTAWVTAGEEYLGTLGPFAVDVPFWSEVEPVTQHLRRALEVPVLVVRLLRVDGGDGARDGHVTYHVETLGSPAPGVLAAEPVDHALLTDPAPLRTAWARVDGLRAALDWAAARLAAAGRPVTGPVEQRKTWNLAGLFRLPTARGPVWLKTTPAFAADEASVIAALASIDPSLVPVVIAAEPGRLLLEHLPGEDCWDAPAGVLASGIERFVAVQAALAGRPESWPPGLPDRRWPVLAGRVRDLLDGGLDGELTAAELSAARDLLDRWPLLAGCGLPDTVVHGDFHSGNWRSDGGPPVLVDFADAHVGHPVLDGLRVIGYLPEAKRAIARKAWIDAWAARVPGADPARALEIAEPLAHLSFAVRYQEFLDGIEPSERVYHQGDPAAVIKAALRAGG
jgi:Ser/Thr protein kinase RdoA (MazF antagonist)